ncbi:MAG: histidine phosphatase family protein [Acidimicrobiales bacterium]
MTLYVVRHGRTEANATGKLLGRADPGLDEVGRRQAAALATVLPSTARVVSSPLRRCVQTAEAFGRSVETDPRLVELDYGELDLISLSDVPAEVWQQWRDDVGFRPPGGETLLELAERVGACLGDLAPDAVDGDVVAVTHVSPVKAAMAWALGVDMSVSWRSFVATASITTIGVTDRGLSLQGFNAVHHLR